MNYKYIATDPKTGRRITAITSAPSVNLLVKNLHSEGLLPLKITEHTSRFSLTHFLRARTTVKPKELAVFTRQLGATLNSGLLLIEALETLAEDMENLSFQNTILKVRNDIMGGGSFSSILMEYPKTFPLSYCQVVRSGEASGQLHLTISNLAKYLEAIEQIKEKVKSAMRYPLFILGFAGIIMVGLLVLLIPKFKEIYAQANTQLPLPTQILINISDFILNHLLLVTLGTALLTAGIMYVLRLPQMKAPLDNLKFKIPLLGKTILHKSLVSNFCRTFGFLIASGVEISMALDISAEVVGHEGIKTAIKQIRQRVVTGGASLSIAIRAQTIFPRLISKMISVGEKSGRLSEMLIRTADYYDQEVDHSVHGLLTLIEPVLIAVIGGMVGLVIIALYLPIFNLATLVK